MMKIQIHSPVGFNLHKPTSQANKLAGCDVRSYSICVICQQDNWPVRGMTCIMQLERL